MAKFSILSSCICRDAFGYQINSCHEVEKFSQSSSPLTWFYLNDEPKKKLELQELGFVDKLSNFQKRCVINDFNKSVLDYYDIKSDFFITDLVSLACTGLGKVIYDDKSEHYFSYSNWFNIAYQQGLKQKIEGVVSKVNSLSMLNESIIQDIISKYISWIKGLGYKDEEIILVANKKVSTYTDGELFYLFPENALRDKENQILDKLYDEFKKQLPKCNVIKMPVDVYADTRHVWGLTDLHFCKEYYDYLYMCLDLIATRENCQEKINDLRDWYSAKFQREKETHIKNSVKCISSNSLMESRLHCITRNRVVKAQSCYYRDANMSQLLGKCDMSYAAKELDRNVSEIVLAGDRYYVSNDDCQYGVIGDGKWIDKDWKTVNSSTMIITKEDSIIISHSGIKSLAQTQIIHTISDPKKYVGKVITVSVYARAIQKNNLGLGGTLAIINASDYNKGNFYKKIDFTNQKWKRIVLSTRLPEAKEFSGLTICLRALAGTGLNPKHAVVEFSELKIEEGSLCTGV